MKINRTNEIELLDCTLRDGGHITGSYFGKEVIYDIAQKMIQSRIDILEAGFLKDCTFNPDYALYNNVAEALSLLPPKANGVKYALLVQEDQYDDSKLEPCNGDIEIIRISFHDYDLKEGLDFSKRIVDKGYQVYINPINLLGYSDRQVLDIIQRVNEIHPYAFSIVDTFGSMLKSDLVRLLYLIDNNLDPSINIGLHLHENQSLSYSLAQAFIEMKPPMRAITVDGSLYGMGRVPGNLCIELIMEYMNQTHAKGYCMEPVYDAIDEYIVDIKKKIPWGYSTAYALSAQHHVHRTFAEYLVNKGTLKTKQINQILAMIAPDKKTRWDKEYIEQLYIEYQSRTVDDSAAIDALRRRICGKTVFLLASGSSINGAVDLIQKTCAQESVISFSANFVWDKFQCDYAFFTNFKRWDFYGGREIASKKIITSNLLSTEMEADYVVNYANYAFSHNRLFDNCGIMLLKLVTDLGAGKVILAGYDGFSGGNNFAVHHLEKELPTDYREENSKKEKLISEIASRVPIEFLTPSLYQRKVYNE